MQIIGSSSQLNFKLPILNVYSGQSNSVAENREQSEYNYFQRPELANTIEGASIYNIDTDSFDNLIAGETIDNGVTVKNGGGVIIDLSYQLNKRYGINVHNIQFAKSGTPIYDDDTINNWNLNTVGGLYERLKTRVTAAIIKMNSLYGEGNWQYGYWIWQQGESDTGAAREAVYKQNTLDVWNDFKTSYPDFTIIQPWATVDPWANIRALQVELANENPNLVTGFSTDWYPKGEYPHYNCKGMSIISNDIITLINADQRKNIPTSSISITSACTDSTGNKIYINFNAIVNESVVSTGINLSGGKTITSIKRKSDDLYKYEINVDTPYLNSDVITISYSGTNLKSYDNVNIDSFTDYSVYNAIDELWIIFTTNAGAADDFQPTFLIDDGEGTLIIDYGDGERVFSNQPEPKNYADSSDKNVNIYRGGMNLKTGLIGINLINQKIKGELDLSDFEISSLNINQNPEHTSLLLTAIPFDASSSSGINIYSNNYTTLDISAYTGVKGVIRIYDNPNLTTVINPSSANFISDYTARDCNISTIDVSGITNINIFNFRDNNNLSEITLPTLIYASRFFYSRNCALNQTTVDNIIQMYIDWYSVNSPTTSITIELNGGTNAIPNSTLTTQLQGIFTSAGQTLNITTN